jgi:hypothetical protein
MENTINELREEASNKLKNLFWTNSQKLFKGELNGQIERNGIITYCGFEIAKGPYVYTDTTKVHC